MESGLNICGERVQYSSKHEQMKHNVPHYWSFCLVCLILGCCCFRLTGAVGEFQYVSTNFNHGAFPLASNGAVAAICLDTNDFWGVTRAAGDLTEDLRRVTGIVPALVPRRFTSRRPNRHCGDTGKEPAD